MRDEPALDKIFVGHLEPAPPRGLRPAEGAILQPVRRFTRSRPPLRFRAVYDLGLNAGPSGDLPTGAGRRRITQGHGEIAPYGGGPGSSVRGWRSGLGLNATKPLIQTTRLKPTLATPNPPVKCEVTHYETTGRGFGARFVPENSQKLPRMPQSA